MQKIFWYVLLVTVALNTFFVFPIGPSFGRTPNVLTVIILILSFTYLIGKAWIIPWIQGFNTYDD